MGFLRRSDARQQQPPPSGYSLDTPLLLFSPHDAWTVRDACEGTQIFGAIGSGKTSGSGAALARSFLAHGFGGLVCCAKPEERQLWQQYAAETGRTAQLIVVSPRQPWRFNFLDYELRRRGEGGGLTENLLNLLTSVSEIVEGKRSQSGNDDRFWERAMKELLRNAIDLLSIARGTLTLEDICRLVLDAPRNADQAVDGRWQQSSFCAQLIVEGDARTKTPRQAHDFEMATRYWLKSYANLDERPRSSIVATFTSIADLLLHGIAWELLNTETNIVPEVTYKNGAVIILDLPVQEYNELGRVVQGIFKLMFQRAILRRDPAHDPRPVFLWADEAQNFISSFDYQYQAVARSARACTVYLTQNISNYYSALGASGHDETNALLGNFQTKIFHANGDEPTNEYAAKVIGQQWMIMRGGGGQASEESSSAGTSWNEAVQLKVLPSRFTSLRKGGPAQRNSVDAIVFQGGRVWRANDDTYLNVVFHQGG